MIEAGFTHESAVEALRLPESFRQLEMRKGLAQGAKRSSAPELRRIASETDCLQADFRATHAERVAKPRIPKKSEQWRCARRSDMCVAPAQAMRASAAERGEVMDAALATIICATITAIGTVAVAKIGARSKRRTIKR